MAKIIITYDTSTKAMSAEMDGKALADVDMISLSRGGYSDKKEEFYFSLLTCNKQEEEGYKTYTQIVAKDSVEGKELLKNGGGTWPECNEFVYKKELDKGLQERIRKYLRGK